MADRPNILSRQVESSFAFGTFIIPGAGLFPQMQLFNPIASGLTLLCDQAWAGSSRLVYLVSSTAVLAAPLLGNGQSKKDFSASVAEIYGGGIATFPAIGLRFAAKDIAGTDAQPMIDGAPIEVDPGEGLVLLTGATGGLGSFTFSWREQ